MSADEGYMARALELAAHGLYTTDPNPRVGCVLVHEGRVVGEGWHLRAGEPHAEVLALRAAGANARGAVAYVTLEPCCHTGRTPPCTEALIAAGVARVVCATLDPNPKVAGGGLRRLTAAGVTMTQGVAAPAARALNAGFFSRFERGRPFIRLKMAMSLDARTASPTSSGWITGEQARADVQTFRARSSAVLTGAGTVRDDDPRLDVRLNYGEWVRQPLRVVLDSALTCSPAAKIFKDDRALVFAADGVISPVGWNARTERVSRSPEGLDLHRVVERLAALEVNELLVECGARLAASFLAADLVDEWVLYVAPLLLGMDAPPLAHLSAAALRGPLPRTALAFEFREMRLLDRDLRLILTPGRA